LSSFQFLNLPPARSAARSCGRAAFEGWKRRSRFAWNARIWTIWCFFHGEMARTRRSRKYSTLSAVVVRFSRSRKKYERQGLLVESGALERAQEECLSDEGKRRIAREKASLARERADNQYVAQFTDSICSRYPDCPPGEAEAIAKHACERYSERVGRSAAAKSFDGNGPGGQGSHSSCAHRVRSTALTRLGTIGGAFGCVG
jgi:hypothetical protein